MGVLDFELSDGVLMFGYFLFELSTFFIHVGNFLAVFGENGLLFVEPCLQPFVFRLLRVELFDERLAIFDDSSQSLVFLGDAVETAQDAKTWYS